VALFYLGETCPHSIAWDGSLYEDNKIADSAYTFSAKSKPGDLKVKQVTFAQRQVWL